MTLDRGYTAIRSRIPGTPDEGALTQESVPDSDRPADASADLAAEKGWVRSSVPEYPADTVNLGMNNYGVSLTFATRSPDGPNPNARIFISHQMASVLQRLLFRILTNYETQHGHLTFVPNEVLAALNITDSDIEALEVARRALVKGTSVGGDERHGSS